MRLLQAVTLAGEGRSGVHVDLLASRSWKTLTSPPEPQPYHLMSALHCVGPTALLTVLS